MFYVIADISLAAGEQDSDFERIRQAVAELAETGASNAALVDR